MLKATVHRVVRKLGYDLVRRGQEPPFPPDFGPETVDVIRSVQPYTMTTPERLFGLIQAVAYIVHAKIPGSIVECGVWRGGSMMAAAYALQTLGQANKNLYLFDTYEGMTQPGSIDVDLRGKPASVEFDCARRSDESSDWCYASIEEVRGNLLATGYSPDKTMLVKGKVEHTIPNLAPEQIAILRLDTDWYESTRYELVHLFPRLSPGGVLIIDDYGHWQGSRKAADEYFAQNNIPILLNRLDYTGRIAVKSQLSSVTSTSG
jgi:O-methyltransferase